MQHSLLGTGLQVMTPEEVVPVRLDVAVGQQRHYQDTFCWSTAATQEAAESFAMNVCRDNQLPQTVVPAIVSAIQQQVNVVKGCSPAASQTERNETIK